MHRKSSASTQLHGKSRPWDILLPRRKLTGREPNSVRVAHLKAGWYCVIGKQAVRSHFLGSGILTELAAEGVFDGVGTPPFTIKVISQQEMAFALRVRSLANPACTRTASHEKHGYAGPRKQRAAAVLSSIVEAGA